MAGIGLVLLWALQVGASLESGRLPAPAGPAAQLLAPGPSPRMQGLAAAASRGFVANKGQWPAWIRFVAQGPQGTFAVEDGALYLQSDAGAVRILFSSRGATPSTQGELALPGRHNYFLGNDSSRWVSSVQSFENVRLVGAAEGVDVVVRQSEMGWKYDIEAKAHGRWQDRRIQVENGKLISRTGALGEKVWSVQGPGGTLQHLPAPAWQTLPDGRRRPVEIQFEAESDTCLRIASSQVDASLPLTIDPELAWSTYFGATGPGPGDFGIDVDFGPDGSLTLAGQCSQAGFPATAGTFQSPGSNHARDTFVARFSGVDGSLVYASRIGGTGDQERPASVMVDDLGRAIVVGDSDSQDFPTTPDALVKSIPSKLDFFKAYALRLSPSGDALEFSTLLPASWSLDVYGADLDRSSGDIVIAGIVGETLRTTPGCLQSTPARSFIVKLHSSGSSMVFSTYFLLAEEQIYDVRIGPGGVIGLCGSGPGPNFPVTPGAITVPYATFEPRAFMVQLSGDGSTIQWAGTIGARLPALGQGGTVISALAFAPNGDMYCVGAGPIEFPITPGAYKSSFTGPLKAEAVAIRLRGLDGALLASTFFGGPSGENIGGCEVDSSGTFTIAGSVSIETGPMTVPPGVYDTSFNGGFQDLCLFRLNPSLTGLLYASYVGGNSNDSCNSTLGGNFGGAALHPNGRLGVAASTESHNFPTTPGAFSPNFFGGPSEAVAFAIDLLYEGTQILGASTPSCTGPISLLPHSMPSSGGDIGVYCTSAPKQAVAWLLVGQPLAAPVQHNGVELWIDLGAPVVRIPASTGVDGYFESKIDLTQQPSGSVLAAQVLLENPLGCSAQGSWSASHALKIAIP